MCYKHRGISLYPGFAGLPVARSFNIGNKPTIRREQRITARIGKSRLTQQVAARRTAMIWMRFIA